MINEKFENLDNWIVSTWTAPQGGEFKENFVSVNNGILELKVNQTLVGSEIKSKGGEIRYKDLTHFGTYKWVAKMASDATRGGLLGRPWTGSCSALFLYVNDSETEIDFEVEGSRASVVHCNNWATTAANTHSQKDLRVALSANFNKYKLVWHPTYVKYYVNDKLIARHTTNIPQAPAYPMINHWGTNNVNWGGSATLDTNRWMYVKKFEYQEL